MKRVEYHPAYSTFTCPGSHENSCNKPIQVIYGVDCKDGIATVLQCKEHDFNLLGESKILICKDCDGTKQCPKCKNHLLAVFMFKFISITNFGVLCNYKPSVFTDQDIVEFLQSHPKISLGSNR